MNSLRHAGAPASKASTNRVEELQPRRRSPWWTVCSSNGRRLGSATRSPGRRRARRRRGWPSRGFDAFIDGVVGRVSLPEDAPRSPATSPAQYLASPAARWLRGVAARVPESVFIGGVRAGSARSSVSEFPPRPDRGHLSRRYGCRAGHLPLHGGCASRPSRDRCSRRHLGCV